MFTSVELDYLRALINTYYSKGYKYYMCHTITENNNEYDMCIYFSQEKIEAFSDTYFDVVHGIRIYVDSSGKSTYSTGHRDVVSSFSGSVSVDKAEFIYTNADNDCSITTIPINPDIFIDYSYKYTDYAVMFVIIFVFLCYYIKVLFGIGGR